MKRMINPYRPFPKWERAILVASALLLLNAATTTVFAQQKPWAAPKEAQIIKNPLQGNNSALVDGKKLYTTNCAPCHGDKGRGDGPAAQALIPKPADHSSALVQSETDGSLFWKLSEGRNPMPGYKKILTEQQRWELINYIRTLAKTPKK
ncbi:MAG: c-type cytochrome [Mucilaginibacter sp.]|nr:c-type cytochrome [Mucilaginibacter sp.]